MLTKWNEFMWLGDGAHSGCRKTQQTGREGSGASHQCPGIRGAYTEDRERFSQRCREGKEQWLKVLMKEILIRDIGKKYAHQQKSPYPWRFAKSAGAIRAKWPNLGGQSSFEQLASSRPFQTKIVYDALCLDLHSCTSIFLWWLPQEKAGKGARIPPLLFKKREVRVQLRLGTTYPHL